MHHVMALRGSLKYIKGIFIVSREDEVEDSYITQNKSS